MDPSQLAFLFLLACHNLSSLGVCMFLFLPQSLGSHPRRNTGALIPLGVRDRRASSRPEVRSEPRLTKPPPSVCVRLGVGMRTSRQARSCSEVPGGPEFWGLVRPGINYIQGCWWRFPRGVPRRGQRECHRECRVRWWRQVTERPLRRSRLSPAKFGPGLRPLEAVSSAAESTQDRSPRGWLWGLNRHPCPLPCDLGRRPETGRLDMEGTGWWGLRS